MPANRSIQLGHPMGQAFLTFITEKFVRFILSS
jgi:hypothetical protein